MNRTAALLLAASLALTAAGCGDDSPASGDRGVTVVATTTVLGDVARNVVGGAGSVEVLIPIGADPHSYQPSSRQAAALQEADLVLANGLGLEEGLSDVLESAAEDGAEVFEIGELLDPLPFGGTDDHEGEAEDDGHGRLDPHVWLDPVRMAEAARLIAGRLEQVSPGGGWAARADAYADELLALDDEIRELLAGIPSGDRKLVTSHHSFAYFADRYGFEVIGTVIPGGSTQADPSSAELAALVAAIDAAGVPAVFGETIDPSALANAVAAELGERVKVVELYTGSLGETGSGADTLIGMLRTNAERIAGALS